MSKKIDVQHSRAGRRSITAQLISWTPNPAALVHHLYFFDKHGVPLPEGPVGGWEPATDEEFSWVFQVLCEDWCPLTEFPSFTFLAVVPRALNDQIRVHRHGSYFSESHQLYEPSHFAEERDYFEIPDLDPLLRSVESETMVGTQWAYGELRKDKILPSLARGVLPNHLNIQLSFTWNMRVMFEVCKLRRCHILQGTYWNLLIEEIKREVSTKVDARMAPWFDLQPCDVSGRCLSPMEEDLRMEGKDPHMVCPRYLELKRTENRSTCCGLNCLGCTEGARRRGVPVSRSVKA